jgi:pyruvate kinase
MAAILDSTDDAAAASPRPALTKIIATLGPASSDESVIRGMIAAGASVFRLNFGHGTPDEHERRVRIVRTEAEAAGRPVAIMGDLQGPKIRLGRIVDGGVDVPVGATVMLQRDPTVGGTGRPLRISCTHPQLIDEIEPGERVLINDGVVRMLAVAHRADEIECTVTTGGRISTGKGINVPDSALSISAICGSDLQHVDWAIANDLDFLALSFVREAAEVEQLREHVEHAKRRVARGTMRIPLIAKIERPAAVENMAAIINAADAIMVARGDLGVEMDLARVPVVQKQLLQAAHAYGKPCIIATQMLESMIRSPSPTRAEVSDVAGAIFDGADAVMLSGETAVGMFATLAVETMGRVAQQTEQYLAAQTAQARPPQKLVEQRDRTAALAHGAWVIAADLGAKFIVVWSQQGGGARGLSQNDFQIPIIAVSTDDRALRQMQLHRGVTPVRMPLPESLAHFTRLIDQYLQAAGWAQPGDTCVLMAGGPIGRQGTTNSLAVHVIGDPDTGYIRHGE